MKHLRRFNEGKELDMMRSLYSWENGEEYTKLLKIHKENIFKHKYGINGTYTVNEDGSIDVDGEVDLMNRKLTSLPVKYGKISGSFNCSHNELTSLEGCPDKCDWFGCVNNNLYDLYFVGEFNDINFRRNPIDEILIVCGMMVCDDGIIIKFIRYLNEFRPIRGKSILGKRLQECLYMCDIDIDVTKLSFKNYTLLE